MEVGFLLFIFVMFLLDLLSIGCELILLWCLDEVI